MNRKKRNVRLKSILRLLSFGAAVSLAILFLYISQPYFIERIGNNVYDQYLRKSKKPIPASNLAVIDIEEESLAEIGQWPWSRYTIAEIVGKLYDAGVLAVGIDIIFSEADRTSPELIVKRLETDFGFNAAIEGLPAELNNYDDYLAERIKSTNTIFAFFARFEDQEPSLPEKLPKTFTAVERLGKGGVSPIEALPGATDVIFPLDKFTASANIGFTNAGGDSDGVIRSVPLVIKIKERIYPSLALAALMKARGVRSIILNSDSGGFKSITIGKTEIPVGANASFWVPFAGKRGTYPYYKAKDILSGAVTAELNNKIVIIGSSAVGLLDIRTTPLDSFYPGVELHLAIIDAIENGRFIVIPSYEPALQIIAIILTAFFAAILFGLMKPAVYFPAAAALCFAVIYAAGFSLSKGVYISPLYIILTILIEGVILVCARFWREESHKRFIKSAFGRYVAPEVVNSIALRDDDFLSGQKRELTIIFSDLRGFTTMSESLDPNLVVNLLNDYFTPMTAIVRNSGGTLDKFIGDALMAFWNAPLDVADHAKKAVEAAVSMQKSLERMNEQLEDKYGIRLKMGIGIHTGPVYVGNMGSDDMVNYTAIGDNVNLASRLEGLSKTYGQSILVSADTVQACKGGRRFIHLDSIRVKGKHHSVDIYSPVTAEEYEAQKEELEIFENGRKLYAEGDFSGAAKIFELICEKYPGKALFELYRARVRDMLQTPPGEWDGSWTFVTK